MATVITDVTELQAMENDLTADYELGNNINASATSGWNSGLGFDPIGDSTTGFTGSFDGKGYTINDLFINRPLVRNVGLFGFTDNGCGTIQNVGLVDCDITGKSEVGALIGFHDDVGGTVDTCYSTGTVDGVDRGYVGGLIGTSYGPLVDSYSTCTVTNTGGASDVSSCGGLAGTVQRSASGCYSTGTVTVTSDGDIQKIGGFTGYHSSYTLIIQKGYAIGAVSVTAGGRAAYVGGFIGESSKPITDCYARGAVTVSVVNTSWSGIGGFVGYVGGSTMDDCYSTGAITATSSMTYVGGFCGFDSGTISNCFWDTQTSGKVTSDGGTGKTTAQMKTETTFTDAGWDFDTIWDIDVSLNNGYPEIVGVTEDPTVTVTTQAVSNIGATTARGNGNITDLGDSSVTAHGVCYNTTGSPTISDSTTDEGAAGATGAFTSDMSSLTANTKYYVKAYATSVEGTSYGSEVNFTTLGVPTITTQTCESVVGATATGRGEITVIGNPTPTAHGHCWKITADPTTGDSSVDNGAASVIGTFISSITGLTPGTGYYTRAYATNSVGTSYGANVYFVAPSGSAGGAIGSSGSRAGYTWDEDSNLRSFDANAIERQYIHTDDVDDAPVDGATTDPISSNYMYDHVNSTSGHPALLITSEVAQAFKAEYNITTNDLATYVHGIKVELTRAADIQPSNGCWFGGQFVLNAGSSGYTDLDKPAYVLQAIMKGSDATPNGVDIHVGRFETQSAASVSDIVHILANTGTTIAGHMLYLASHINTSGILLNAQSSSTMATGIEFKSGSGSSITTGIDMSGASMTADIKFSNSETISGLDDTPVNAATTSAISSNWAYGHVAGADPHVGYVLESLFDADTFLYASSDDTPVATSPANVLVALSGHAGAAFGFNAQDLSNIGHIGLGNNAASTRWGLLYDETVELTDNNSRAALALWVEGYKTSDVYSGRIYGGYLVATLDAQNTQIWSDGLGLVGAYGVVFSDGGTASEKTIGGAASFVAELEWTEGVNDAKLTNYYGFHVVSTALLANDKLTNDFGIWVGDQAGGATLNYAIYTNAGLVHLGDAVDMASTLGVTGLTTLALVTMGDIVTMADTKAINTGVVDDDYFSMGAVDNDTNTITELMRFVGAAAPHITFGAPTAYKVKFDPSFATRGGFIFGDGADSWDLSLLPEDASGLRVMNAANTARRNLTVLDLHTTGDVKIGDDLFLESNAAVLKSRNEDSTYAMIQARQNGVGRKEIARMVGAAEPRFQHTLPLNLGADKELTIATGVITVGVSAAAAFYRVDTEADADSDDLDTINGGAEGDIIVLKPENTARTIVVKHSTGNLVLAGLADFTMDNANDIIVLIYDGTNWLETTRSSNRAFGEKIVYIKVIAHDTALTTADDQAFFTVPDALNGMNLVDADIAVYTTSSATNPSVQLSNHDYSGGAQDMLSTTMTIDAGGTELSSYTAATPPVINTSYDDVATGDRISVDVKAHGTGTKGLDVILTFQLP